MKAETTYMKTLGKVEAKLSRMKEQAAAVRWFYENGNLPESYNRALRRGTVRADSPSHPCPSGLHRSSRGQQLKRMRSYPIRFLLKLDLRPRMVFHSYSGTVAEESIRLSGLYPVLSLSGYAGSSLRVSLRSAFGIACLPTAMCMIEADRSGPCGITIISKPIWSRTFWHCMFCPTITRQFARITIAALPEARPHGSLCNP